MCHNSHICERDKCSPKAVHGPTTRCIKCLRTFYLLCFGFPKCGTNAVKTKFAFDSHFACDPNSIVFTCGACDAVFLDDAVNHSMETTRKNIQPITTTASPSAPNRTNAIHLTPTAYSTSDNDNPISNATLKKEIMTINSMLKSVKQSLNIHTDDLSSIKQLSTDIYQSVNHSKPSPIGNIPVQSSSVPQSIPFSQIMQDQRTTNRNSMKRSAAAMKTPTNDKPKQLPAPKLGTRTSKSNLKIASVQAQKPKFDKSIHVSRIDKSVSLDMINDYIAQNSQLKPSDDFRCTLLVKKDKDINSLSFISYKIDVNSVHFAELIDVNFWPEGAYIREFIPQERKSQTLADFLPNQPVNEPTHPSKLTKINDVTNTKNETIQPNIMNEVPLAATSTTQPNQLPMSETVSLSSQAASTPMELTPDS